MDQSEQYTPVERYTRAQVEFYQVTPGYPDVDGPKEWRWRLKAGNNEIVASGEGHATERDADRAFRTMVVAAVRALATLDA